MAITAVKLHGITGAATFTLPSKIKIQSQDTKPTRVFHRQTLTCRGKAGSEVCS